MIKITIIKISWNIIQTKSISPPKYSRIIVWNANQSLFNLRNWSLVLDSKILDQTVIYHAEKTIQPILNLHFNVRPNSYLPCRENHPSYIKLAYHYYISMKYYISMRNLHFNAHTNSSNLNAIAAQMLIDAFIIYQLNNYAFIIRAK